MIRNIAVGLMFVGLMFLAGQSLMAKSGLECPPQPFPITLPPELAEVPGMKAFAEHIDRQIEEIYLRFCFHIDSLKDSLVVADSLILDSTNKVVNCCPDDSLPDTDEGCLEVAERYHPCYSEMTFDADAFTWINDTAGATDAGAGGVTHKYGDIGNKFLTFDFPTTFRSSWEIQWSDTVPGNTGGWTSAKMTFDGSGAQRNQNWQRDDGIFIQKGIHTWPAEAAGDDPRDTITFAIPYSNRATYQVTLQPVHWDAVYNKTWDSDSLFVVHSAGGLLSTTSFVIVRPGEHDGKIFWTTYGTMDEL